MDINMVLICLAIVGIIGWIGFILMARSANDALKGWRETLDKWQEMIDEIERMMGVAALNSSSGEVKAEANAE